jgi:hypothetical protein
LSKEEKLGKNADGLEDLGEHPHPLEAVSDGEVIRQQ